MAGTDGVGAVAGLAVGSTAGVSCGRAPRAAAEVGCGVKAAAGSAVWWERAAADSAVCCAENGGAAVAGKAAGVVAATAIGRGGVGGRDARGDLAPSRVAEALAAVQHALLAVLVMQLVQVSVMTFIFSLKMPFTVLTLIFI